MNLQLVQDQPVIKARQFIPLLQEICRHPPPVHPLPGLKYKRILIPNLVGGELAFSLMGFLGLALRQRGAEVTALSCDSLLPACVHRKIDHVESACTRWCHKNAGPFADAMGLPHRWYSEFITAAERRECDRIARDIKLDDIPTFSWRGVSVGHLITQSVGSAFKVGFCALESDEMVEKAYAFVRAAMYLIIIAGRALDELRIDKVFTDNGVQVDWGVIRAVAGSKGVPVDVVQTAPRPNTVQFEHDRPGQPTARMPQWSQWRSSPLTEEQERALDRYLAEREISPYLLQGVDWRDRCTDPETARRLIGLGPKIDGKVFVMFPNVGYDEDTTKDQAILSGRQWILRTIDVLKRYPRHILIVKAHPAEAHLQARDPVAALVAGLGEARPPNVLVVPPESTITAQCALRLADIAIVYTSTVTAEAAGLGKPIILVGGGFHSGRGMTEEPRSPEAYTALLDDICAGKTTIRAPRDLGRRYAYSFFLRSCIPLRHFHHFGHEITHLYLRSLDDLRPGRDPTVDTICRGILLDEPIVNPEYNS